MVFLRSIPINIIKGFLFKANTSVIALEKGTYIQKNNNVSFTKVPVSS